MTDLRELYPPEIDELRGWDGGLKLKPLLLRPASQPANPAARRPPHMRSRQRSGGAKQPTRRAARPAAPAARPSAAVASPPPLEAHPAAAVAAVAAAPTPYRPLSLESPRVAARDAQQRAMFHLQHGRQVLPKRGDSMAVMAVAEMVAAMKKVEVGVLDAEREAASERDLRKQTEARAATAEARASDAEAVRDRLRKELDEWKAKAARHQQQDKESRERLEVAVAARTALEKQVAELSASLAESTAARTGLEAELEMTRQQLQEAAAFAGWGQTPARAALRWGSAEWWSGGGRVGTTGAVGAHGSPRTAAPIGSSNGPRQHSQAPATQSHPPAPAPAQSAFSRATDGASAAATRAMDLEAELSAAAHERERLARDLGVVFDHGGSGGRRPATAVAIGSGGWVREDAAKFI